MFNEPLSKSTVLSRISEEEIFERYIGFLPSGLFKSPLRNDNRPTCSLKRMNNGKLIMRDWAGYFTGDCFSLVQELYNCKFYEALAIIARDFNLSNYSIRKPVAPRLISNNNTVFQIKPRLLNDLDSEFWSSFHVRKETLNLFRVCPISFLWINRKLSYVYKADNPAYCYYFSKEDIKIYMPYNNFTKFLCNTNYIQGYDLLPTRGDILFITKSYKDVMVLYEMGFPAIAPQGESQSISDDVISNLKTRFKRIIIMYDYDLTGVRFANKLRKQHNLEYFFFHRGRNTSYFLKDVSDNVKADFKKTKQTIETWLFKT